MLHQKCDDANPNVKMEFEILKTELLARKSAVVLGFNIAASARKIFYFQQFSSILRFFQRPLVDCELEIECDYQPSGSTTQYIVFGSEVQRHGQNNIIIPIYETEMLTFCGRGRIGLAIRNAEHERTTFINDTMTRRYQEQLNPYQPFHLVQAVQPPDKSNLLQLPRHMTKPALLPKLRKQNPMMKWNRNNSLKTKNLCRERIFAQFVCIECVKLPSCLVDIFVHALNVQRK
uniref:Uncharacterized protein n=1 Tax=Globodera rostochiensis TaxID=31243 RepID=A0A914IF57_GLORO